MAAPAVSGSLVGFAMLATRRQVADDRRAALMRRAGSGADRDGDGMYRIANLVGRGRELRAVRRALRDGLPVVIAGGPGLGRTALARAALHPTVMAWGGGLAAVPRPYLALERALRDEAPAAGGEAPDEIDEVAGWAADRLAGRTLAIDDLHLTHPATPAVLARLAGTVPLVVTLSNKAPGAVALRHQATAWAGGAVLVELAPLDGASAARLIRRHAPQLDAPQAARLAAAVGGSPTRLVTAAATAARSTPAVAPYPADPTDAPGRRPALTARESEVLELIASGSKTSQIALRLGIAESTVESHVRAVRTKLGVPTRTAAAALGAPALRAAACPN
jgi:DNA-binding NarL/FixJ family response regulator